MSDSIKSKKILPLLLPPSTITVRNVPHQVDAAITEQAKLAGKSKSDYVQEFLTAHFNDLIGNFIRTSELVALMDREMARMAGTELSDNLYDLAMTQAGHREFCRILGIKDEEDLQRMMLFGMPLLEVRVKQLKGVKYLARGNSLYAAMLASAVSRDADTAMALHRSLFSLMPDESFQAMADELRRAMRMKPFDWPVF
ncbi:hypothetical protein [Pantoea sp. Cy-640]|uniref:hypothetical protein n=1 Tax=Pantoea sp. Cy-640 TaxID=2608353 RepID=UPI00141A0B33|nr:hypothetical protein [Pantoea sp. Cy-640]NIG16203.1 hypothetical protein [Pantoea sp. Cy-640]